MNNEFHDFNHDAKLPSKKESIFNMLMLMNEELGYLHNDFFQRCLHDMQNLNKFLRDSEPLKVLESVTLDFNPHDEYILLSDNGCYESLSKEQAIKYMIDRKDSIIQEFLKNLDSKIARYWNIYLKDDDTDNGGTAYDGETLIDFLLENFEYSMNTGKFVATTNFLVDIDLQELNEVLIDSGIKPLEEIEVG